MLTPEQCESYQRDGYLLVPNLFSKEQLAPALEVAEKNAYGKSLEAFNAELDTHPEIAETLITPKGRRRLRPGPRIVRRTQQNERTHPRPTRHRTRILSL